MTVHLIPSSEIISFTPIKKRPLSVVAVEWGLNTTPKQTAKEVVFFRNSIGFAQWMCEELASSSQGWQCRCTAKQSMEQHWSGAGLSTRLLAFKKANTGNPFFLASTQPEEAPTRAAVRNFCPPLSLLGNAVPLRLVEEGSWNLVGLSNHFRFFCYNTFLQGTNTTFKTRPHLPMNDAFQ